MSATKAAVTEPRRADERLRARAVEDGGESRELRLRLKEAEREIAERRRAEEILEQRLESLRAEHTAFAAARVCAEDALRRAHRRERRIAASFQRSVLRGGRMQIPGYDVGYAYRAALTEADTGGDFANVFRINDQQVGLVVGDVGGKGLDAATIAARVQQSVMALAVGQQLPPASVLKGVRRTLDYADDVDRLVTLFLGTLHCDSGKLEFSTAGHEPALLWREVASRVVVLPQGGPAICGITVDSYATREEVVAPGDMLLLLTDGLPEARTASGAPLLGRDAVERIFTENLRRGPSAVVSALCDAAARHSRRRLQDDIVLLVIGRKA